MTTQRRIFTVNKATAEIKIYGFIEDTVDNSWNDFQNELNAVAADNTEATIRINSGGGDMIKGMAMYDSIRNSSCKFTGIVEGIAASMAGPIFMACDTRLINQNARIMLHRPQGVYAGEAEGFASFSDLMKQEEQKLINIFTERTGQPEDVVKSWFVPGAQKWFNAADAVKYGIATGIVNAKADNVKLQNFSGSMKDIIGIYNSIIDPEEIKPQINTMKKEVLAVLNAYKVENTLTEDSTEKQFADVVEGALKAKDQTIAELTNKLQVQNDATIENALSEAIDAGKITAEQKADWKGILTNNLDMGLRTLKGLAPKVDVNNTLTPGDKTKGADDRKDWTARDWEIKDAAGWAKMKIENKAKFDQISEAYYGNEETK